MSEKIQAVRGMNDILPEHSAQWQHLENEFKQCLLTYGYQEIRTPLLEQTQLFKRAIGEVTDIVEKEMYTFCDLNGDSLTLRPEGTAGCLRACMEHGLLYNQHSKLWYVGSMFRHEKPQKGRYRQFTQFGVEALGIEGVAIELELIAICRRLWTMLGIENYSTLQINTLGDLSERQVYKEKLIAYFKAHYEMLDEDSRRRLEKNPLRILDSKNTTMQAMLANAPRLLDFLGSENKRRFEDLCNGLEKMGFDYVVNPFLVRGLDYYGQTVFEWVTPLLGSQATICAGGRYDKLLEQIGGGPMPAVGFAMGADRLLLLLENLKITLGKPSPSLFIITGEQEMQQGLLLAESLHNKHKKWQIITNTQGSSFKSQFKKADKSGAVFALILGDEEVKSNRVSIKNLRQREEQITVSLSALDTFLQDYLEDKTCQFT